jgi:GTPase SAR1 family protein
VNSFCLQPGKRPERYLKWANGFIVVYSIVSRESYDEAARYLDELSKHQRLTAGEAPVVLVGNKADLERYRCVATDIYRPSHLTNNA